MHLSLPQGHIWNGHQHISVRADYVCVILVVNHPSHGPDTSGDRT